MEDSSVKMDRPLILKVPKLKFTCGNNVFLILADQTLDSSVRLSLSKLLKSREYVDGEGGTWHGK